MGSARLAFALFALLAAAHVSALTSGLKYCDVSPSATSKARAFITHDAADPAELMTVQFELPLERLFDVTPAPENYLRNLRFSAACSAILFEGTSFGEDNTVVLSNLPSDGSYFDALYVDSPFIGWTAAESAGDWDFKRDDSGTCSVAQFRIKKSIESLINAGCLSYAGTDENGDFLYHTEFHFQRFYSLKQTLGPDGDIAATTRSVDRYVSEYFSVEIKIDHEVSTTNNPSVSTQVVNGRAVLPSTNNALSSVTISTLLGNTRQVEVKVAVLVNYPYNLRLTGSNAPGIAYLEASDCRSSQFEAFGDVCQQFITIRYEADACTTSRSVELTSGLLKYTCGPNTYQRGHCEASEASFSFDTNDAAVVLDVDINSEVSCTYDGTSYTGTVSASAKFVKGLLGGATSWVHPAVNDPSPYLYYYGANENQNVYVEVSITNDENIDDPTDIYSVTFTGTSSVDVGGSGDIPGTPSSNTDTTSTGCGLNPSDRNSYTGCLIVPLPTTIPKDNKKYDVTVGVDMVITLSASNPDRRRHVMDTPRIIRMNFSSSTQISSESQTNGNSNVSTGGASTATIAIAVIVAVVALVAIGGAVLLAIVIRRSQTAAAAPSA